MAENHLSMKQLKLTTKILLYFKCLSGHAKNLGISSRPKINCDVSAEHEMGTNTNGYSDGICLSLSSKTSDFKSYNQDRRTCEGEVPE